MQVPLPAAGKRTNSPARPLEERIKGAAAKIAIEAVIEAAAETAAETAVRAPWPEKAPAVRKLLTPAAGTEGKRKDQEDRLREETGI